MEAARWRRVGLMEQDRELCAQTQSSAHGREQEKKYTEDDTCLAEFWTNI